jgi:hypothetical protein
MEKKVKVTIPGCPGYYLSFQEDFKKIEIYKKIVSLFNVLDIQNNPNNLNKNTIYHSVTDIDYLFAYVWVLKNYYVEECNVYVQNIQNIQDLLANFNNYFIIDEEYYLSIEFLISNVQTFNNLVLNKSSKETNFLIFSADLSLHDLMVNNKKRINTIFSYPFKRIVIFSISNLNFIHYLHSFKRIFIKKLEINYTIISDPTEEDKILKIKKVNHPVHILKYLINQTDLIVDEPTMDLIDSSLAFLNNKIDKKKVDSVKDYSTYEECLKDIYSESNNNQNKEVIMASDDYFILEPSQKIKNMDLSNLSKTDYEIIRTFVKIKLFKSKSIDIRTCQLATPSSPKNRSKNLNSLSNKISSIDYLCDATCEIFEDYSIGVVIWTELFADKSVFDIKLLSKGIYIYQTTSGRWKFTM